MTSKNLFFKLMREDVKRKLWAVSLAFLAFFFALPVNAAMSISNLQQSYQRWIQNGTTFGGGMTPESHYAELLLEIVKTTVGMENALAVIIISTSAIVMALTGFMYLHSRKQVDFYHSIPVKREEIFAVKYLNGILIILFAYIVNMILAMGILAINGVQASVFMTAGCIAFAVHAGGFIVNYGLMVLAVMLTGNFFISILGAMVLFAYIPALLLLTEGLMSLFYATLNFRTINFEELMVHGSPISYYINCIITGAGLDEIEQYGTMMGSVGVMYLVGAVMALSALFLYKKRPSESAGKAMAFKVTKAPIKILMVTPITIASSILFWTIYYSVPWAVFGFVIGLVVSHCVVEIIYHFEFRKLFANLYQMGICAVLSLVVIAMFRYDLFGYDRYKPAEKDFESATIYASNLQDGISYGLPYQYMTSGTTRNSWRYIDNAEYAVENMKFTDYAIVSQLADAGIAEAKREKEIRYSNQEDTVRETDYWTSMEIGYTLKNGKTVYRNYRINVTDLRETFEAMYTMAEYKDGIWPVLSYQTENLTGIYETADETIAEVTQDPEMIEKILTAYQEELKALTLDERANTTPVTSLRFLTIAERDYICAISQDRNPNYNGGLLLEDMNVVNFFPVYPSFEQTLALLKEAGVKSLDPINVDDVLRIEIVSDYYIDDTAYRDAPVSYYTEATVAYPVAVDTEEGVQSILLEDDGTPEAKATMEQVLASSVNLYLVDLNGLQSMELGFVVRVYMKEANEGRVISNQVFVPYLFQIDQIPEFVKEAFDYDQYTSKYRSHGLNQ